MTDVSHPVKPDAVSGSSFVSTLQKKNNLELFQRYSPLIFTLFYFVDPIHNATGIWYISGVIASYVAQLVLYHFIAVVKNQKVAFVCIMASIALGFICSTNNASAYAFHWFCAYFGGARYSFRIATAILALVLGVVTASGMLFGYNQSWYYISAIIPILGLFAFGCYDQLIKAHENAQQQSKQQIEQLAQVAERERIARDIHDVMGHSLTTIALKSQLANKLAEAGDYQAAQKEIEEVANVSSDTLSQMRSVISGYKAKSLNSLIDHLTESLQKWKFTVTSDFKAPELNAHEESTIALALTEAVTNIIKHSQGNEVAIKTTLAGNNTLSSAVKRGRVRWHLQIRDNGNVNKFTAGNGLKGMQERIEAINGKLEINHDTGMCLDISLFEPSNSE